MHNFTLTKGGGLCGENACCFSGGDGNGGFMILSWAGGNWSMQVFIPVPGSEGEFYSAGYTGTGDVCAGVVLLTLQDGSPDFPWDETVTLTYTPP